jgi:hypothetical protein
MLALYAIPCIPDEFMGAAINPATWVPCPLGSDVEPDMF